LSIGLDQKVVERERIGQRYRDQAPLFVPLIVNRHNRAIVSGNGGWRRKRRPSQAGPTSTPPMNPGSHRHTSFPARLNLCLGRQRTRGSRLSRSSPESSRPGGVDRRESVDLSPLPCRVSACSPFPDSLLAPTSWCGLPCLPRMASAICQRRVSASAPSCGLLMAESMKCRPGSARRFRGRPRPRTATRPSGPHGYPDIVS